MVVVDTSALLLALADPSHNAGVLLAGDGELHAPHLVDVEYLHAVRRLTAAGEINETQADQLLESLRELRIERYSHRPLTPRIWSLRHNLTAYDAAFVALAETLDVPLITADAKMASAPGNTADIRVV